MKLKRIQSGVYETPDRRFRVEREGYEQLRDDEQTAAIAAGDARYRGSMSSEGSSIYHSGVGVTHYYAPEVPVWMVFEGGSEDHKGHMFDTLREAREYISTRY